MTSQKVLISFLLLWGLLGLSCQHRQIERTTAGFEKFEEISLGQSFLYKGPFILEDANTPARKPAKVFLPVPYDKFEKWPLVIMLHGFSATGDMQDAYLGLSARASIRGFILLSPNGLKTPADVPPANNGRILANRHFWNATDACCDFGKMGVNDTEYLLQLIEKVKATYKIDSERVYLLGYSNGGFMAERLACETPESFAALANLAGGTFKDVKNCKSKKPLPYLHAHAQDDETISYHEEAAYAGGRETVKQWIQRNQCSNTAASVQPKEDLVASIPGEDTELSKWKNCESGAVLESWVIKAHQGDYHSAHTPVYQLKFTDRVLDFLFAHSLKQKQTKK